MYFHTCLQPFLQEQLFVGHKDKARNLAHLPKIITCLLEN